MVLNSNQVYTIYKMGITSFTRLGAPGLVIKAVPFTTTAVSSTNTLQNDMKTHE